MTVVCVMDCGPFSDVCSNFHADSSLVTLCLVPLIFVSGWVLRLNSTFNLSQNSKDLPMSRSAIESGGIWDHVIGTTPTPVKHIDKDYMFLERLLILKLTLHLLELQLSQVAMCIFKIFLKWWPLISFAGTNLPLHIIRELSYSSLWHLVHFQHLM